MSVTTEEIETRIDAIAIDGGGLANGADDLLDLDDKLQFMQERIRDVREKLKALFIAYIKQHGPIVNGTVRYFVDEEKETKCLNVQKTIEAILAASEKSNPEGYPVSDIALLLSTQPWKNAACKKFIGEVADDLFETKVKPKLKQDGTRDREQLVKVDTKYIR